MMTSFLWCNKSSCALVHPNYSKSEVETFIVKLVQFAESVFYTEVKMPHINYFTMCCDAFS